MHHIYESSNLAGLYESLSKLDNGQLRFIRLQPGSPSEALVCNISTASLGNHPEYEALSYTWQDPDVPGAVPDLLVLVNGITIFVLSNLGLALKRLRHASHERVLWIDFLCINQADIAERNAQVRQMGEIYHSAKQVVAFVGDSVENTKGAVELLFNLSKDVHFPDLMGVSAPSEQAIKDSASLIALLSRAYYRRVWTVQELALARESVLQCGEFIIPGETVQVARDMSQKHQTCCALYLQNNVNVFPIAPTLYKAASRWEVKHRLEGITLANLLSMFPHQQASDPRDQVFSFLGLLDPSERLVEPDYSLSTEEVYTMTAREIIKRSLDLGYLAYVNHSNRNPSLPSWVPDLERHAYKTNMISRTCNLYSCYGSATPSDHIHFNADGNELILQGLFVDTVSEIDQLAFPLALPEDGVGSQRDARSLYEYLLHIEDMALSASPKTDVDEEASLGSKSSGAQEDVLRAVWRTATKGVTDSAPLDLRRIVASDYPSIATAKHVLGVFATLYSEASPMSDFFGMIEEEKVWHYSLVFTAVGQSSRFFLTAGEGRPGHQSTQPPRRRIGMGPVEVLPGDRIFVVAGGRMPFVLRPLPTEIERDESEAPLPSKIGSAGDGIGFPERDRYELVGMAYVDGIMDGELAQVGEQGQRPKWETIRLC